MKPRKSISKLVRFEIFKRDSFTCQYCGRRPPVVVLNADHILPVASGGGDDTANLITSCFDCNSGKGAKLLGVQIAPLKRSMEDEREKFDQLKAYQDFLAEKTRITEEWFSLISATWIVNAGEDPSKWIIGGDVAQAVRRFMKLLPASEIIDAVDIAFHRMARRSEYDRLKFFCGVCWKKVRDNEAANGP